MEEQRGLQLPLHVETHGAAGEPILLGVFNWGESAAAFKVSPRRITAGLPVRSMREFWRGESREIPRGGMTVDLEGHQSRLFVFE